MYTFRGEFKDKNGAKLQFYFSSRRFDGHVEMELDKLSLT